MDPQSVLPGARSVIVCAINYNTNHPLTSFDPARAWISRYAWGKDYHETLQEKLRELARWIESQCAGSHAHLRGYRTADGARLREVRRYRLVRQEHLHHQPASRVVAVSGMHPHRSRTSAGYAAAGSLRLVHALPRRLSDGCLCRAIRSRQPEMHFVHDDRTARRDTRKHARDGIGHHLFGCDICQDVCPWNRRAPMSEDRAFQPQEGPALAGTGNASRASPTKTGLRSIRGTPLKRAKVRGLLRNLMVVAGNSGLRKLIPQLQRFLNHDDEHVRSHAAWAIRKLETRSGARQSDGKLCVDATALILSNCRKELPFLHGVPHRSLDVNIRDPSTPLTATLPFSSIRTLTRMSRLPNGTWFGGMSGLTRVFRRVMAVSDVHLQAALRCRDYGRRNRGCRSSVTGLSLQRCSRLRGAWNQFRNQVSRQWLDREGVPVFPDEAYPVRQEFWSNNSDSTIRLWS